MVDILFLSLARHSWYIVSGIGGSPVPWSKILRGWRQGGISVLEGQDRLPPLSHTWARSRFNCRLEDFVIESEWGTSKIGHKFLRYVSWVLMYSGIETTTSKEWPQAHHTYVTAGTERTSWSFREALVSLSSPAFIFCYQSSLIPVSVQICCPCLGPRIPEFLSDNATGEHCLFGILSNL